MKYFEELEKDPKIKNYFDRLIGIDINEACKKLGYWWRCSFSSWPYYHFERSAGGRVELRTNEKNIVESVHYNGYALLFAKIDIYDYKVNR